MIFFCEYLHTPDVCSHPPKKQLSLDNSVPRGLSVDALGIAMPEGKAEYLKGTLDLLILKIVALVSPPACFPHAAPPASIRSSHYVTNDGNPEVEARFATSARISPSMRRPIPVKSFFSFHDFFFFAV